MVASLHLQNDNIPMFLPKHWDTYNHIIVHKTRCYSGLICSRTCFRDMPCSRAIRAKSSYSNLDLSTP